MDTLRLVQAMVAEGIAKDASDAGQMTLGALIDALKLLPEGMPISWDFGGHPGDADSYRGYYEQLAFAINGNLQTAGALLQEAQAACGETFYGYKGGEYVMHRGTWVWAAEYGTTGGSRRVSGIKLEDGGAVLLTAENSW